MHYAEDASFTAAESCSLIFGMWFTRTPSKSTTVAQDSPSEEERYTHIYKVELPLVEGILKLKCDNVQQVREELGLPNDSVRTPRGIYTYVNAMRLRHPRLLRAEAEQRDAIRQHNAVLAEGAELGRKLGYIR